MKITVDNLVEQYPKINIQLPKELNKDEFEFIKDNIDLYSEDDTIKKYVDTFVLKLNEFAAKKDESKKKEPSEGKNKSKPSENKLIPKEKDRNVNLPKFKKGNTVYIKKTGEKVKIRLISEKRTIVPGKTSIPTIIYLTDNQNEYQENELTNVKPKEQKEEIKKKKTEPQNKVIPVEHFTIEEKFIKRYLLLDGKTKTKDQVLNLLKALQKAIVEKQIRKASKHAGIIEHIQKQLLKLYNTMPKEVSIKLDEKSIEKYGDIVGTKKVRLSVTYIKRFIGLYGKETKEKVKKLQDLISKAVKQDKIQTSDPYFDQIMVVQRALKNYLNGKDMSVSEAELRGLTGIAGLNSPSFLGTIFDKADVVSSLDLQKAVFRYMGFTGVWKKIIGDPEEPFHIMVYGPGGKGKSTFGVNFATYLSKELQRQVLYVADEEKISGKLKDKLQRFNSYNDRLSVTGEMPSRLEGYDVIFLDSVTSMGIEPEDFEIIQEQNPTTSFIYILQTNKQGSFYGKRKWEHLCDVVLRFEDGMVSVEKNRFGKVGRHSVV